MRLGRTSLIVATAARYLLPLQILLSIFLLVRGHNEPGGGFVGGLVAASAFALYAIAIGIDPARRLLRVEPQIIIGVGLLVALGSGLVGPILGASYLTGIWSGVRLPVLGIIGTPLLFDVGVYLVVLGVVTKIVFTMAEEA